MKHLMLIAVISIVALNSYGIDKEVNPDIKALPEINRSEIKEVINKYIIAINHADAELASQIFLTTSSISFIQPKGHLRGWGEVKKGIYEMFGTTFSKRDLKTYDETITLYDDMAVVEFYWIFDATFSGANPATIQTKGRETQVMKKFGKEWKIVHVHYSNMPVKGEREGF